MVKTLKRTWPVLVCVLALVAFAPAAHAINVDFTCSATGSQACNAISGTGTVTVGGGNASGNFSVFNSQGIVGLGSGPWTANFNTATGTISITGLPGGSASGTFSNVAGVGFTISPPGVTTSITLIGVLWSVLPPVLQAALGTPTGLDNTTITIMTSGGAVQSTDVLITPTPEPASMVLLGSALVAAGSFLRRLKRT